MKMVSLRRSESTCGKRYRRHHWHVCFRLWTRDFSVLWYVILSVVRFVNAICLLFSVFIFRYLRSLLAIVGWLSRQYGICLMEMWIQRRVCLWVVFSEGVMKSMVSSNTLAIRTCLMGPGEFIALQLGVVQVTEGSYLCTISPNTEGAVLKV
jgi:uncharacterized membrane protein